MTRRQSTFYWMNIINGDWLKIHSWHIITDTPPHLMLMTSACRPCIDAMKRPNIFRDVQQQLSFHHPYYQKSHEILVQTFFHLQVLCLSNHLYF